MNKQKKARTKRADECPTCEGLGYTAATATEWEVRNNKYKTLALGSGCPTCQGRGIVS